MTEYFITNEGGIRAIQGALDAELSAGGIWETVQHYWAQFAYKCQDTFCPFRRQAVGRLAFVGFPSQEALEEHRIRDHEYHGLRRVSHSIIGTPWWECECGHTDMLGEDEPDVSYADEYEYIPESRRRHLALVGG